MECPPHATSVLLARHARTFSLTLGLLPRSLREPLSLGYLLARASDTIADSPLISRERGLLLLSRLDDALVAGNPADWSPSVGRDELLPGEAELFLALPHLLRRLSESPDRAELCALWRTILEGQLFDLGRFGPGSPPLARWELERYCGLVAGSVGEAWTRLTARHSPRTLLLPPEELLPLASAYGRGLQLVNILRDRERDREIGRCYVREEEVAALTGIAASWLRQAEHYLAGLRPGRILTASSLPLDLAKAMMDASGEAGIGPGMKLSRRAVRSLLLGRLSSLCFPRRINPAS